MYELCHLHRGLAFWWVFRRCLRLNETGFNFNQFHLLPLQTNLTTEVSAGTRFIVQYAFKMIVGACFKIILQYIRPDRVPWTAFQEHLWLSVVEPQLLVHFCHVKEFRRIVPVVFIRHANCVTECRVLCFIEWERPRFVSCLNTVQRKAVQYWLESIRCAATWGIAKRCKIQRPTLYLARSLTGCPRETMSLWPTTNKFRRACR